LHNGDNTLELLGREVFNGETELLALGVSHWLKIAGDGLGLCGLLSWEYGLGKVGVHTLVLFELMSDLVEVSVDLVDGGLEAWVVSVNAEEVEYLLAIVQKAEQRSVFALTQAQVHLVKVHGVTLQSRAVLSEAEARLEGFNLFHCEQLL
jgi:hypothetical protein